MTQASDMGGFPGQVASAFTYARWSTTDKSANFAVDRVGTFAVETGAGVEYVRGTIAHRAGKHYAEFRFANSASFNGFIGIREVTNVSLPNSGLELLSRSAGTLHTGTTGATAAGATAWNPSNTIMLAVDFDAAKVWIGKDGVWFNSGNPETGANPTFSSFVVGANGWVPSFVADNSGGNHVVIGNFGRVYADGVSPFAYAPPAGFREGYYS